MLQEKERQNLNASQNSLLSVDSGNNNKKNSGLNLINKFKQASNLQRRKLFPDSSNSKQPDLTPTNLNRPTNATHTNPNQSPYLNTKSWFQQWTLRPAENNYQQDINRDKEFSFIINDHTFGSVKANLIRAFISVSHLYILAF